MLYDHDDEPCSPSCRGYVPTDEELERVEQARKERRNRRWSRVVVSMAQRFVLWVLGALFYFAYIAP
ncbi:MAG: hypothetical protein V4674_02860 [Patescibacteria group bacterium]